MNEEKLLREFIAALETLTDVYNTEHCTDESNPNAEDCDIIHGDDISSYNVKDKIIELKKRLWSLPLWS